MGGGNGARNKLRSQGREPAIRNYSGGARRSAAANGATIQIRGRRSNRPRPPVDVLAYTHRSGNHHAIRIGKFGAFRPCQCSDAEPAAKLGVYARARENLAPACTVSRSGIYSAARIRRNGRRALTCEPASLAVKAPAKRLPVQAFRSGARAGGNLPIVAFG